MLNTILKIIPALSIPAIKGYVANTIGTAPLRPTHEMNNFLFIFILKGNVQIMTLKGLATTIRKTEIRRPIPIKGII